MMANPTPEQRAIEVLDTIADDPAAWHAMTSILNSRALRESLVNARRERGLTQAMVAERMGVTQPTVSEFETTRYPDPRISTLHRYARAIDCRVDLGILAVPEEPGDTEVGP